MTWWVYVRNTRAGTTERALRVDDPAGALGVLQYLEHLHPSCSDRHVAVMEVDSLHELERRLGQRTPAVVAAPRQAARQRARPG